MPPILGGCSAPERATCVRRAWPGRRARRAADFALGRGRHGAGFTLTRLPLTTLYFVFGFLSGQSLSFCFVGFVAPRGAVFAGRRRRRPTGAACGGAGAAGTTGVVGLSRPAPLTMNAPPAPGAAIRPSASPPSSAWPGGHRAAELRAGSAAGDLGRRQGEIGGRAGRSAQEIRGTRAVRLARGAGEHVDAPVAVHVAGRGERGAEARAGHRARDAAGAAARRRGRASRNRSARARRRPLRRPSARRGTRPTRRSRGPGRPSPFWSPTLASEEPSPSPAAAPSIR